MYLEFYGLSKDPFSSVSSRHIRLSASQRKAISDLHYGLEYGHRVQLLLADSGLGKTTLLLYLEARLKTSTRSSRLFSVDSENFESVNRVVRDLNSKAFATVLSMPTEEIGSLRTSENDVAQPIILLIDDAHALSDADLQKILSLTKLDVTEKNYVFIVLAGRLELLDKLRRLSSSNSFKEIRVAPLSSEEVEEYVSHRLRLAAGEHEPIFTPAAIAMIARQSRGVPKGINNLCQVALAAGVKHQLEQIDASDLDIHGSQASSQSISHQFEARYAEPSTIALPRGRSAPGAPMLLTLGIVIAATGLWYEGGRLLEAAGISVNGNAPVSTTSLTAVDHSAALKRERIDETSVESSGSISSGKSSAPVSLEGSSAKDNVSHGPPLPNVRTANLDVPQSGRQVRSSVDPSKPTRAIASAFTPAARPQSAAGPSLTPSVVRDPPLTEQPRASAAAQDLAAPADARRSRIRTDAGDDYMRRGEYARAITSYEAALALSPGDEQLQRRIERARRAKATEAQILWPSSP
jgi:general secretion pathway protein A